MPKKTTKALSGLGPDTAMLAQDKLALSPLRFNFWEIKSWGERRGFAPNMKMPLFISYLQEKTMTF
ncbi:hypothetical protein HK17_05865 [Acetobacter indonesiensis]|uniref:Uncharacterized protein n=1 Tax=Acetobacter indonesiensis TaxID=104101 RepID=A0A252AYK0_9PROT|nr:hypothetical protein HK17_05865 [Acetobacter indonesiensis]